MSEKDHEESFSKLVGHRDLAAGETDFKWSETNG